MSVAAPDMSVQIAAWYNQAATAVTTAYATVESYCDAAEKAVSDSLERATTAEVRDVALKFFKALPETFMVMGLLLQGKLAMISAICWAVRTVISLMPLLKTLLSMDMDQINKGAKEAWVNLVKQHKNFIPALAIVSTVATMHVFHLLSLKALLETAVFATMTAALISTLIEQRPAVAAPAAGAGGPPSGPGGALPFAKPVDPFSTTTDATFAVPVGTAASATALLSQASASPALAVAAVSPTATVTAA